MTDVQFGSPAWIDTVLDRIQTTLQAATIVAEHLVFVYEGEVGDLLKKPPANKFIVVSPGRGGVDQAKVAGGGAGHTVSSGEFRVDVCQYVGGDQEFRSARLLKQAGGLSATVALVAAALQVQPLAATALGVTSTPLVQPMRLVAWEFNPRTPISGWAWCRTVWAAPFRSSFGAS